MTRAAGPDTGGPLMFVRYAYPPNALGYCGPGDFATFREYAVAGVVDRGLVQLAQAFIARLVKVWLASCQASRRASMNRRMSGVKINCIASSIFPPGTTMMLGRDINESSRMDRNYGKSMPLGLANRMTRKLSSAVGMKRAMNGFDVSTVGTRWKFTCVRKTAGSGQPDCAVSRRPWWPG